MLVFSEFWTLPFLCWVTLELGLGCLSPGAPVLLASSVRPTAGEHGGLSPLHKTRSSTVDAASPGPHWQKVVSCYS